MSVLIYTIGSTRRIKVFWIKFFRKFFPAPEYPDLESIVIEFFFINLLINNGFKAS